MADNIRVRGTQINYYYVCKRKLWLFSHGIQMEQHSELVEIGKEIHEQSYQRKRKEIELNGIKIDFMEIEQGLIHEVKKSRAIETAHIRQLQYYLFRFKELGLEMKGKIDYPLIRKVEEVELDAESETEIQVLVEEIKSIVSQKKAIPAEYRNICKKCSYYDYCFI